MIQGLHREAITDCGGLVVRAADSDLRLPTPCSDWDLGGLIGHLVGQNEGFAAAVRNGDAPLMAYDGSRLRAEDIRSRWKASKERLTAAFAAAAPDARVRLAELDREVDVRTAIGMQLLDSAVHAWDLAVSLGEDYRPADGIVEAVREGAGSIAALPGGAPGVFSSPLTVTNEDPWTDALRLLGRSPTWAR